jgi:hypothetical protein
MAVTFAIPENRADDRFSKTKNLIPPAGEIRIENIQNNRFVIKNNRSPFSHSPAPICSIGIDAMIAWK